MSHKEQIYTTSDLCAVVGIKPANLRLWRNSFGLFPETRVHGTNKREWNRFSLVDICAAQSCSLLLTSGWSGKDSAGVADKWLRLQFMMLMEDLSKDVNAGEITASTAAICFGGADGHTDGVHVLMLKDGDAVSFVRDHGGHRQFGVYIDFLAIIHHVLDQLLELKPETIPTRKETLKIVARALAKGISEGGEND